MRRKCEWCGRTFEAKTRRSRFCCDKCRVYFFRARTRGAALPPEQFPPGTDLPGDITDELLAEQVLSARGCAAFFDAASVRGPEDKRELCHRLASGIAGALREVGL